MEIPLKCPFCWQVLELWSYLTCEGNLSIYFCSEDNPMQVSHNLLPDILMRVHQAISISRFSICWSTWLEKFISMNITYSTWYISYKKKSLEMRMHQAIHLNINLLINVVKNHNDEYHFSFWTKKHDWTIITFSECVCLVTFCFHFTN